MASKYAVETAFKLIDKATEPLAKIGVQGNAVGKQLKKDFLKAQDQLTGIGKAAKKAAITITAVGAAAAGAFAVKGVKDAIEFNTAFTKVSTIADTTNISLDKLSKQIIKVSDVTGMAANELAQFQYKSINLGIKTADSAGFVQSAVKAAKASFSDTGIVIEGLTKVINAYGLEATDADRIAGQMYIATSKGNASFEQLNSTLGKVLPTAARLNVGTDELFASITALTANSIETPKAMKGIEKILETITDPTAAAAKAARKLGIEFSATALRSKGLEGFLRDIKEKTGGSEDAIMSLFGSIDSLNAITVLTGEGANNFTNALESMKNASGAVDTAFNKVMESPAERWGKIMNKIKNAGITLGTELSPIIEKVMVKINGFVDKMKDFDFKPIADKAAVIFDKIWSFAGVVIKLAEFIWKLRVPILAVVGALAIYRGGMLLAAATVNAFTAAQNVMKAVQLTAAIITGNQTKAMALYKAGTMGASIQTILFSARQKAAAAFNFIGVLGKQAAAFLLLKVQLVGAKIATIAYAVAQKAAAIGANIAAAAQWAWNAAMTANPIGLIIAAIVALIAIIVICVKNWDKITDALKNAWEWVKKTASMIWEGLCNAFIKLKQYVSENSEKVFAFIAIFSGPFAIILSVIKELRENWGAIVDAFKTEGIIAGFKKLGGVILSAVLAPIQGLLEVLAKIPGVNKLLGPAVDKIKSFREELKGNGIETEVTQKITPQISYGMPPQMQTKTANSMANVPNYGIEDKNTKMVSAAAMMPTRPMTTAEQYVYNQTQTTNREQVDISVKAEQGSAARVTRQPKTPNVTVAASGGNK